MHAILNEALRRKDDIEEKNSWPLYVYKSYIKARLFEQAKQLSDRFPQYTFEKFPEFKDQHKKDTLHISLMQLENDSKTLIRNSFLIPAKEHIIVVSHPFCHFSQNAQSTITSDLELKSAFINHPTWVMPSKGTLDIDGVLEANNDSPIKYRYIYLESEWPEIDYWGTPAFCFYKTESFCKKLSAGLKKAVNKKS